MTIQAGDTVTIRRGKSTAGQQVTILKVNEALSTAAVEYADGSYGTQNLSNIKEAEEPTIMASDLIQILALAEDRESDSLELSTVLRLLDGAIPGFKAKYLGA